MFRLFKQIYDSADVKVRNLLKVIRNRPFFDLSSFPLHSPLSQPLSICLSDAFQHRFCNASRLCRERRDVAVNLFGFARNDLERHLQTAMGSWASRGQQPQQCVPFYVPCAGNKFLILLHSSEESFFSALI